MSAAAALGATALPFGRAFSAVSAVTLRCRGRYGRRQAHRPVASRRGGFPRSAARATAVAGGCRLRRRSQDLQRHVRSQARDDRPLPGRSGRRALGAIREGARAARRRAWRRAQSLGAVGLRRRTHDRPFDHAKRARGPGAAACAHWRRRIAGRSRSRDAGVRTGHDHRYGLAYRRWWSDAGRRLWTAGAPIQPELRPVVFGRRRDRGRPPARGERDARTQTCFGEYAAEAETSVS